MFWSLLLIWLRLLKQARVFWQLLLLRLQLPQSLRFLFGVRPTHLRIDLRR